MCWFSSKVCKFAGHKWTAPNHRLLFALKGSPIEWWCARCRSKTKAILPNLSTWDKIWLKEIRVKDPVKKDFIYSIILMECPLW